METQFAYTTEKVREKFQGLNSMVLEELTLCAGNSADALYYEDYNNQLFTVKVTLLDGTEQNILNMNIDGYRSNGY